MRRPSTVLLVIDLQQAHDERARSGERRSNPRAVPNVERLLAACRRASVLVMHVRDASPNPASRFHRDAPGYDVIPAARELPGEHVLVKHAHDAFMGTDLEARLRAAGVETVLACGAVVNHCVESTVRTAADLGFETYLVDDATFAFDLVEGDGTIIPAEQVHRMSVASLRGEFALVIETDEIIGALDAFGSDGGHGPSPTAGRPDAPPPSTCGST
jgi:nicotinamidase-related amidase